MPTLYQYRLFVSHVWRYSADYTRMMELLTAAPNFSYANYSVPQTDPFGKTSQLQLEESIRNQIRPTQIALILGGMYVAHSQWIQFEIDFAKSLRKPILGIQPWGAERMPTAVTNAAAEVVGWNTNSIVSAIRRLVI